MEKERKFFKSFGMYNDETIETMKKYYNIENSHEDLLKYIKKHGLSIEE